MRQVQPSVRQKVVTAAAVAVLLGGGAFAAVSATGAGNDQRSDHRAAGKHLRRGERVSTLTLLLAPGHLGSAAVDYLGLTPARLQAELEHGQTLAQLAEASPGKSKAGLTDALIAARRQKLASGVAAGRLTEARSAKRSMHLQMRIEALVARKFAGRRAA